MKNRISRFSTTSFIAATLLLGMVATLSAVDAVSRRDAARLQAKLDKIAKNAGPSNRASSPLRTAVTESEVNSYLRYELNDKLPTGVKDPWVSILGDGRLSGKATVDLSQVSESHKSGGMLDPYNFLTGSLPITADGVLKTKSGVATFVIQSATISGVPVPIWMLQEIVSHYSRSTAAPQGVSIDKPFALPAAIREIELDRGQAIIVQ
jgi:hypothetical protein